MRLFPRFVIAFVVVAFIATFTASWLSEQAARGRIRFGPPEMIGSQSVLPIIILEAEVPRGAERLLKSLQASQVGATIIALSLALIIGSLLASRLVRPIRALTEINRRYLRGERDLRYSSHGTDELHELGMTFNLMADQIKKEQQQHKQLVADVAHELRTPLTVLKGELEYIQDGITQASPQVIQRLSEEVDLLVRLVGDLRLLSLSDSGDLKFNLIELDFTELLENAALAFAHLAKQKNCSIVVMGEPAPIRVDRERIQQVLYNLLDNAVKHTRVGTEISCDVQKTERNIVVQIRDQGTGLAETDLQRVFERLYRTDNPRTREDGGSGLGLAIVKTLVEAHNGAVNVKNHPEGGAIFTVILPKAHVSNP
jgi:two-component system, OmpR family, sensor histidine kinase BaeS